MVGYLAGQLIILRCKLINVILLGWYLRRCSSQRVYPVAAISDHRKAQVVDIVMKQAFVDKTVSVAVQDTEVPVPKADEVLIRVAVSGTNPKDWKVPGWFDRPPANQGDDIAGYIETVGSDVVGFKKGDRVAAFHEMLSPFGSYGEYAIAHAHTTFHIPEKTSFEGQYLRSWLQLSC